jgi:hypothetical protein
MKRYGACALLIALTWVTYGRSDRERSYAEKSPRQVFTKGCLSARELSMNVTKLSSSLTEVELIEVRKILTTAARSSAQCRDNIIQEMTTSMATPLDNLFYDSAKSYLWRNGCRVLEELNAVETLEFMMDHLMVTDGLSTNMNHFFAVEFVIARGANSIPNLSEVLRTSPNPVKRKVAIFCIVMIGGSGALEALETSQQTEVDGCNRKFVEVSIAELKAGGGRVTNDGYLNWYSRFLCQN